MPLNKKIAQNKDLRFPIRKIDQKKKAPHKKNLPQKQRFEIYPNKKIAP